MLALVHSCNALLTQCLAIFVLILASLALHAPGGYPLCPPNVVSGRAIHALVLAFVSIPKSCRTHLTGPVVLSVKPVPARDTVPVFAHLVTQWTVAFARRLSSLVLIGGVGAGDAKVCSGTVVVRTRIALGARGLVG